jgi:hypothetical protein
MVARLPKEWVRRSDKRLPFSERPMNEDVLVEEVDLVVAEEEALVEVEEEDEVVALVVEAEADSREAMDAVLLLPRRHSMEPLDSTVLANERSIMNRYCSHSFVMYFNME